MSKDNQKDDGFGTLLVQLRTPIICVITLVSTVVAFINLIQDNTGLVTGVLIVLGITLIWLACFYFARLWKPENNDGKTGLILPESNDKQVKRQSETVRQRKGIRGIAIVGLVLVPLLAVGGYGTWVYVQGLPDEVIVLVAEFDGPDMQNYRVTETILSQLRNATESYDNVQVLMLEDAITEREGSEKARMIAKQKKADIVIWGWYGLATNTAHISTFFEISKPPKHLPDLGDNATVNGVIQTFDIAELDSFSLQTRLSTEMSYLTLFTLGLVNYAAEDWDRAIAFFDDALNQADKSIDRLDLSIAHFYKGYSHIINEDYEEAIKDFDKALTIRPELYHALTNKGNALNRLGRYDEALIDLNKALTIKPDLHEALTNKGNALNGLGRYDEAAIAFDRALIIQKAERPLLNSLEAD